MQTLYGALPVPYAQVREHTMLRSDIGILMRHLAAEPRNNAEPLFSQWHGGG